MHTNVHMIVLLGMLLIVLLTCTSINVLALPLKLADLPTGLAGNSAESKNLFDEQPSSQLQQPQYPRFESRPFEYPTRTEQQAVQKRRFAMGMPNLIHIGMVQKRQSEQLNFNKRRIGMSMPSILYIRGVEKRPRLSID